MRTGLITGAASGLGRELAKACHARRESLLLTDIDAARVAELGTQRVLGCCAAKSALSQAFEVLRAAIGRDGIHLLLWRLTPGLSYRQVRRRFAAEMA